MKLGNRIRSASKWLTPGIGIKRWLLLLTGGIAVLSLGFSFVLREFYPLPRAFYYLTLQFVPRIWRGVLLAVLGGGALVWALISLNRTLLAPFVEPSSETVVNAVYAHRLRDRGPKVVAIGGGHGLSVLLRGLKGYTSNITAIVTVADDGGSSGQLRRDLGVLPPGDFRNCIAALADDEALITKLFQYRFPAGVLGAEASDLLKTSQPKSNGHSFGNLFITAMAEVTGSFERAILESSHVLAVRGRVVPSTLRDVTLMADLRADPTGLNRVAGESRITEAGGTIARVYLSPDNIPAYPEAVRALLDADLIVAGPGSLYTSVLPNLLVPDIAKAIEASRATRVYVCNVATQVGETQDYNVADHVEALKMHVGTQLFPLVLANNNLDVQLDAPHGVELVALGSVAGADYRVLASDLVDPAHPWRHASDKLTRALLELV
jgi:uncharacterized cofD-like protein